MCQQPTANITYEIKDSLIAATYTRRKNIFAGKETYANIYSLNPHTRINTITGIKVAAARPLRFGIGPYVGCGFNGVGFDFSAGVSVHYSLIRF